jgi:hypothetical protein
MTSFVIIKTAALKGTTLDKKFIHGTASLRNTGITAPTIGLPRANRAMQ